MPSWDDEDPDYPDDDGVPYIGSHPDDLLESEHEEEPIVGVVVPFKPPQSPAPYQGMDDVEILQIPSTRYLIDPWIPEGAFVLMYSDPGVGKSFLALEWSMGLPTGRMLVGTPVQKGAVAYIAAEGIAGYRKRVMAWKQSRAWEGRAGVTFFKGPFSLLDQGVIRDLNRTLQLMDPPPKLVVVDTLARCAVGADENSAKDMGMFVAGVDQIRKATGAAVLVVHHAGKGGSGERGSSALRGAADVVLKIELRGKQKLLRCEKTKDAEEPEPLPFILDSVDLGEEEGDSCVVNPSIGEALTETEQKALDSLVRLTLSEGGATLLSWIADSKLSRSTILRLTPRLRRSLLISSDSGGKPGVEQRFVSTQLATKISTVSIKLDDD